MYITLNIFFVGNYAVCQKLFIILKVSAKRTKDLLILDFQVVEEL